MTKQRYLVVSPVKDEEKYIEATLRSVVRQTVRPALWIIVDDGSRDATPQILERYRREHDWIKVHTIDRDAKRRLGVAEVRAFDTGYHQGKGVAHDFVVKLDCDVNLPDNYFEELLARFADDPALGIASGQYLEEKGNSWFPVVMPDYHAAGASKVIRTACYEQIDGFVLRPGWDTVDEIKARAFGWRTGHFSDVSFRHLKPEGSASGYLKIATMCGEIDYMSGVGPLFSTLKAFRRMAKAKPFMLNGMAMLVGFWKAKLMRKPKLVTDREARCYQELLSSRMVEEIRKVGYKFRRRVSVVS